MAEAQQPQGSSSGRSSDRHMPMAPPPWSDTPEVRERPKRRRTPQARERPKRRRTTRSISLQPKVRDAAVQTEVTFYNWLRHHYFNDPLNLEGLFSQPVVPKPAAFQKPTSEAAASKPVAFQKPTLKAVLEMPPAKAPRGAGSQLMKEIAARSNAAKGTTQSQRSHASSPSAIVHS